MKRIKEYKEMVDQLKLENLDVFAKIENSFRMWKETHRLNKENQLKPELRPAPLTVDTTFTEVKRFWGVSQHTLKLGSNHREI